MKYSNRTVMVWMLQYIFINATQSRKRIAGNNRWEKIKIGSVLTIP